METESHTNQENETTGVSESQVDTATETVQATEEETRTLSQEEVNRIVAERVERERKKFEKKFEGVDPQRYRELVEAEEARKVEEQKKRGEFDEILKSTVQKKDSELERLQNELQTIKVDGAMLNAASSKSAINPQQVVSLLKNQVRMSETGDVEIVDDSSGQVRYTDSGDPMTTDDLVNEFLQQNPHFVTATPTGSGSQSNTRAEPDKDFDPMTADLTDPAQRARYAEWRKNNLTNVRKVGSR